jgi:hypothetical protein
MNKTRTQTQMACDGVQAVWYEQRSVAAQDGPSLAPSMDGVIAPDTVMQVASEQHRRDIMQIARVVNTPTLRPLVELKKTMDGIRLPLKGYTSA